MSFPRYIPALLMLLVPSLSKAETLSCSVIRGAYPVSGFQLSFQAGKVFVNGSRVAKAKNGTVRDPYLGRLTYIQNIGEDGEALIKLYSDRSDFPDMYSHLIRCK